MKLMSFIWFAVILNICFGLCGSVFIPLAMPEFDEKLGAGNNPLPYSKGLSDSCETLFTALHGFNWDSGSSVMSNLYGVINNGLLMITGLLSIFWNFVLGTITFLPNIITYFFDLPDAFVVILSLPIVVLTAFTFIQLLMGSNRSFLYFE